MIFYTFVRYWKFAAGTLGRTSSHGQGFPKAGIPQVLGKAGELVDAGFSERNWLALVIPGNSARFGRQRAAQHLEKLGIYFTIFIYKK